MSYIGAQPTTAAFITDTFNGTGSATAFTLSAAPANTNSIIVAVSGVLQDPSTYSVSGTTLTFSAAPPSATGNISVRFLGIPASGVTTTAYRTVTEFTATAGQTTFSVPSYTVGYIDVYRNGVKLGAADFTATNGTTVVLASGASSGDFIQTVSFYVSSVLNAIPATAGAVNSTYLLDGSVTQAKLGTGVAGNGPAFSAYGNSTYSATNGVDTKVRLQVERFDTANCFDNATNFRFTPNVAGYYQVNYIGRFQAGSVGVAYLMLFKNGSLYIVGSQTTSPPTGTVYFDLPASDLVYMNGTTDYLEVYLNVSGSSILINDAPGTFFTSSFSGFLARAA